MIGTEIVTQRLENKSRMKAIHRTDRTWDYLDFQTYKKGLLSIRNFSELLNDPHCPLLQTAG